MQANLRPDPQVVVVVVAVVVVVLYVYYKQYPYLTPSQAVSSHNIRNVPH